MKAQILILMTLMSTHAFAEPGFQSNITQGSHDVVRGVENAGDDYDKAKAWVGAHLASAKTWLENTASDERFLIREGQGYYIHNSDLKSFMQTHIQTLDHNASIERDPQARANMIAQADRYREIQKHRGWPVTIPPLKTESKFTAELREIELTNTEEMDTMIRDLSTDDDRALQVVADLDYPKARFLHSQGSFERKLDCKDAAAKLAKSHKALKVVIDQARVDHLQKEEARSVAERVALCDAYDVHFKNRHIDGTHLLDLPVFKKEFESFRRMDDEMMMSKRGI